MLSTLKNSLFTIHSHLQDVRYKSSSCLWIVFKFLEVEPESGCIIICRSNQWSACQLLLYKYWVEQKLDTQKNSHFTRNEVV